MSSGSGYGVKDPGTFIDLMEDVVEIVSDWGVHIIEEAVSFISPDGRGFGERLDDEAGMIGDYVAIRGNPAMWANWIAERAQQITMKLQESTLSPEEIASIHPWDVAQKYAIGYSARMEDLIARVGHKYGIHDNG